MEGEDIEDIVNALPDVIACIQIGSLADGSDTGFSVWEEDEGAFWYPESDGHYTTIHLGRRLDSLIAKLNETLSSNKCVALGFDFSRVSNQRSVPLRYMTELSSRLHYTNIIASLLDYEKLTGQLLVWEARVSSDEPKVIDKGHFHCLTESAHQDCDRNASVAAYEFRMSWVMEELPLDVVQKEIEPLLVVKVLPRNWDWYRLEGNSIEERLLLLHAQGLTLSDITQHMEDEYGVFALWDRHLAELLP